VWYIGPFPLRAYAMLATSADLGAVRDLDRLPRY